MTCWIWNYEEYTNWYLDVLYLLLLSRWPPVQSARPASSATCPTPAQAASIYHVPEPQLTGQSEEPQPTAHSRPGGRLAEYGGMRPAAGQLGLGQQCGPGEQASDPRWPTSELWNSSTGVIIKPDKMIWHKCTETSLYLFSFLFGFLKCLLGEKVLRTALLHPLEDNEEGAGFFFTP